MTPVSPIDEGYMYIESSTLIPPESLEEVKGIIGTITEKFPLLKRYISAEDEGPNKLSEVAFIGIYKFKGKKSSSTPYIAIPIPSEDLTAPEVWIFTGNGHCLVASRGPKSKNNTFRDIVVGSLEKFYNGSNEKNWEEINYNVDSAPAFGVIETFGKKLDKEYDRTLGMVQDIIHTEGVGDSVSNLKTRLTGK